MAKVIAQAWALRLPATEFESTSLDTVRESRMLWSLHRTEAILLRAHTSPNNGPTSSNGRGRSTQDVLAGLVRRSFRATAAKRGVAEASNAGLHSRKEGSVGGRDEAEGS